MGAPAVATAVAVPGGGRREPPRLAAAVDPHRRADVLLVGPHAANLRSHLVVLGCSVECATDLQAADAALRRQVYGTVVIDPDVHGQDGVSFAVARTLASRSGTPRKTVPFVILPLAQDPEFLVYRGYDDFTPVSCEVVRIEEIVMDLLRP